MCLTQDNLPLPHPEQARRLCAAGARWIQLRMKHAPRDLWTATAREVAAICRAGGAVCIVNDDVEIALAVGADGVHLGSHDADWRETRRQLGPDLILGGTVNNLADADRASVAGVLDYAGVGPWRFTANKQQLAPVLGPEGIRAVLARLGRLPAWAIGGIGAEDLSAVRATGATGAAVSSALFRDGRLEENFRALAAAWGPPATT